MDRDEELLASLGGWSGFEIADFERKGGDPEEIWITLRRKRDEPQQIWTGMSSKFEFGQASFKQVAV